MLARENFLQDITQKLAYLQTFIEYNNSLNLMNINIHAENFFRDFLNLVYKSDLKNANYIDPNYAHIDLIDNNNKKAIQITSQNDSSKINKTIEGFFTVADNKEFELKVLLISKDAKAYKTDFTQGGIYNFDHTKDVVDMKTLLKEINDMPVDEIDEIAKFLSKEILLPRPTTEMKEVETIMNLIEFLSKDDNRQLLQSDNEVDPDKKINKRFSEHSGFITEQYLELYAIYAGILQESKQYAGIDGVKAEKISSYLKSESDDMLNSNNNNPREALIKLIDFFENKITSNGIKADKQAIKFYLLDELIRCNVFPNPKN